jgi:hypothetical protein
MWQDYIKPEEHPKKQTELFQAEGVLAEDSL